MEPTTIIYILSAALAVEQALAQIPAVKANSIFQAVCNITNSVFNIFGKK